MNDQNTQVFAQEKADSMKNWFSALVDREIYLEQNLTACENELSRAIGSLQTERTWRELAERTAANAQEEVERLRKELTIAYSQAGDLVDTVKRFQGHMSSVRMRLQQGDEIPGELGPEWTKTIQEAAERLKAMESPDPKDLRKNPLFENPQ